ncbi:BatA domain-containing protein [Candidatus Woesearchaeota archaeon]|nr:BatA domain-containing protein [Candidatus Woesearchaeota archaeon]
MNPLDWAISQVDNPLGLYALLALLPLLILYFVRPQIRDQAIPSLMFLIKLSGKSKMFFFIRRFIQDFLFLFHFLMILLLAAAVAQPFAMLNSKLVADETVLVIDTSASMQSSYEGTTRFAKALDLAQQNLGTTTSIVLIGKTPKVLLEAGKPKDAKEMLASLKPTGLSSNIADAMLVGANLLKGNGKLIVLSDFLSTTGPDVGITANLLKARGIDVELINLHSEMDNAGIITLNIGEQHTDVYVKNYAAKEKSIRLSTPATTYEATIKPGSVEVITIPTVDGTQTLKLLPDDGFPTDNTAWVSKPPKLGNRVLYITSDDKTYFKSLLTSLPVVETTVAVLPIIPDFNNYDIFILGPVKQDLLLTGTLERIEDQVKGGKTFILMADPSQKGLNFGGLLPVALGDQKSNGVVEPIVKDEVTQDLLFGLTKTYWSASPKENTKVFAAAGDNSSIIALGSVGKGRSLYFGIPESASDFKLSTDYPLFWNRMFSSLLGIGELSNYNHQTGDLMTFSQPTTIVGPRGTTTASSYTFADTGVYRIDGKDIAVNLASEAESNVGKTQELKALLEQGSLQGDKVVKTSLVKPFILAGLLLLLVELLFLKYRGDI